MTTIWLATVCASGALLGAAAGALSRRLIGGWAVPCRPRERQVYETRIAELQERLDWYEGSDPEDDDD
jgi:hypothetical protein